MMRTGRIYVAALAAVMPLAAAQTASAQAASPEQSRAWRMADRRVADGSTAFALGLFRAVAAERPDANVSLSPLGAWLALAMTMQGAAGTTLDSMRVALGVAGIAPESVSAAAGRMMRSLRGADGTVNLRIANAIWASRRFDIAPRFADAVTHGFNAPVMRADFGDPRVVGEINAWAARETSNRITKVVDRLDPDLAMLLLNATYFKGAWARPFDPARTQDTVFTLAAGATVPVKLMRQQARMRYAESAEWQAAELPYGNGALAMVVLVPKRAHSVHALLRGLDTATWSRLRGTLAMREVALALPRFRLEWDGVLNDALASLGMGVAFSPRRADFTRMSPGEEDLFVSRVRQKTFVDVNEERTEAAAVTSVEVMVTSAPPPPAVIRADRPFVFVIHERASGAVLFVGKVMRPGS